MNDRDGDERQMAEGPSPLDWLARWGDEKEPRQAVPAPGPARPVASPPPVRVEAPTPPAIRTDPRVAPAPNLREPQTRPVAQPVVQGLADDRRNRSRSRGFGQRNITSSPPPQWAKPSRTQDGFAGQARRFVNDQKRWVLTIMGTLAAVVLGYAAIAGSSDGSTIDSGGLPVLPDAETDGAQGGSSLSELAQATVQIIGLDDNMRDVCTGSGILVNASGIILTNAHVVTESETCPFSRIGVALTQDESRPPVMIHTAEVLRTDMKLDLAVLRIDGWTNPSKTAPVPREFPVAPLGDSDTVGLGDRLRILGYPAIGGETITSTSGEVSGFTSQDDIGVRALIKTDASISAGNSGGMALSANGKVIGIPFKARATETGPAVDCRAMQDTNGDGLVDDGDNCVTVGGFLNGIRPINLASTLLAEVTSELEVARLPSIIDDVSFANPRFSSGQQSDAPIDRLTFVPAGLKKLCLFADWSGIPNGTQWDGVWYHDGEAIPAFSTVGDVWDFGESGGNFWMCASDPNGLEDGTYEVGVFLNGELAFAEAIKATGDNLETYPVTWLNVSGGDLCGLAVNPLTEHRQVGANELVTGERIPDGGQVTLSLPEGTVIAEAYDCNGQPIADALEGLEISEPITFEIGG